MSANTYPSPASSATQSNVEPALVAQPPATTSRAPDHYQTQSNLQHASTALQAAYRRIRQVRRSLLELSDAIPTRDWENRVEGDSELRPRHDAIMLTGSMFDDSGESSDEPFEVDRLRDALPAMEGRDIGRQSEPARSNLYFDFVRENDIPDVPSRYSRLPLAPLGSISESTTPPPAPAPPPLILNSPISPPRLPRRSLLESGLLRRRELSDDPSTTTGRRVAALEAAGSSNYADSPVAISASDESLSLPLSAERDFEHLRSIVRQRRSDPGVSARVDLLLENIRRTNGDRPTRSLDTPNARNGSQNTSNPTPRTSYGSRRFRYSRPTSMQSPVSPSSDRLSLLSNFSIQNLPTPTSSILTHPPILFDEPLSYVQPSDSNSQSRNVLDRDGMEDQDRRGYYISRRLNSEGQEHVHNVQVDWSDDAMAWLMPTRDRLQQDQSAQSRIHTRRPRDGTIIGPRMTTSPPPEPTTHRRHWARLDADGNEIPYDEEEEIERNRLHQRLRTHERRLTTQPIIEPSSQRLSDLIPVTQTSIYADEDATIYRRPRVRLGRLEGGDPFEYNRTSLDLSPGQYDYLYPSRHTAPSNEGPEYYGSDVPFYVDPLPMPLSEMVSSPSLRRKKSAVRVHKNASLAGR
ncbi:uncharacterized protein EV420DRAFT_827679 [Desarmillaria tabescens]|uniref:Uncharacterized protein n=1 Tax=Armillaria tabescens TaxID=1929756 RepID=A0AA39NIS3_ARMTA|nr:uncharacterized protein EV420DRAFT_827679 [Desarmillaria tabescens]KAK0466386.1 hypothetical protein EV420DRAFT_827679 [Desarmillaria tabescens]